MTMNFKMRKERSENMWLSVVYWVQLWGHMFIFYWLLIFNWLWIKFSFFVYIFIFIEHWPLLRLWTLFSSFEHLDSYSHGWLNTLNLCNRRFILLMWICVKLKVFPELLRTHSPESIFHNTWLNLYFKLC